MFLCSLRYCLKCYFSKGAYSFTLSTVYIVSGVLKVEMGVEVLTVKEKLKQVDMLRLEVGSKGLRAYVPHKRERCRSFWKGRYCGELTGTKRIYHMMNNKNLDNNK